MRKEIQVINGKGLHARPATIFAEVAGKHEGEVKVSYGNKTVNGKSLLTLLSLAVPKNGKVIVTVDGEQAETMMNNLTQVLGKNYD